jgi:urease accessory protein
LLNTITTIPTHTTTRTSETGHLRLLVERRGERTAVVRAEGHVPYAPRLAPIPGPWARVVLVQTIAGPLAGDNATIEVDVGPGAALELIGNAATLALPCKEPARQRLRFRLQDGARVAWLPQPVILTTGCNLVASLEFELAVGSAAVTREVVVLGRHGESSGRYRSSLRCELEGRALLHDAVEIDDEARVASSGAVLAGARAFASLSLLGIAPDDSVDPDELALHGPGRVLRALAADTASLRARIAPVEAAYLRTLGQELERFRRQVRKLPG